MRECSSCQTVNDDKAQFCLECGQKMAPAGRPGAQDDQPNAPAGGRPRLHSPILGGYEEIDDSPRRPDKSRGAAPKQPGKPAAHLRSPLLGGGDDDEDFDEAPVKPIKSKSQPGRPAPSGGKLRSPLFGGGGGGGGNDQDDYEEDFPLRDRHDDRSPFPHRNRPREADPEMPAPSQSAGGNKAHLRSPLLGGSDDGEYDEAPSQPTNRKGAGGGGAPRPQKLHSPIFDRGGSGGSGGEYNDYDDDDFEEIDDPSVLRSPLLAAKSRVPLDRPYPPRQPGEAPHIQPPQGRQPNLQQQQQQPAQQQQQPPQQQQPNPQYMQPAANMSAPLNPGQPGFGAPNQPAGFANQPGQPMNQQPQPGFGAPPLPGAQSPFGAPPNQPDQPLFNAPAINAQPPAFTGQNPAPASPSAFAPANSASPGVSGHSYEYGTPGSGMSGNPNSPFGGSQPSQSAPPALPSGSKPVDFDPPSPSPSSFGDGARGTAGGAVGANMRSTMPELKKSDFEFAPGKNALAAGGETEEFTPHPAVQDLAAPAPKRGSKLSGGRFGTASAAPPADSFDDDDDPKPVGRGKGLPLSVQDSSRKRFDNGSDGHRDAASVGAPSGPIMVIFITACLAAIGKAWYMVTYLKEITSSMPWLLDQVGQLAIVIGLIIYAAQGSKK